MKYASTALMDCSIAASIGPRVQEAARGPVKSGIAALPDSRATVVGRAGGGHTALTPEGETLVGAYERFQRRVEEAVEAAYAEEFAGVRDAL
jgi:hypothetical protein